MASSTRCGRCCAGRAKAGHQVALAYLDLDGFKGVNDACGHEAGDRLLTVFASRIRGCIGASDLFCRLGGDEFVVALDGIGSETEARARAGTLLAACLEPCLIDGRATSITPSIGVALSHEDPRPVEVVLNEADAAMYAAKRAGGAQIRLHDPLGEAEVSAIAVPVLGGDSRVGHPGRSVS